MLVDNTLYYAHTDYQGSLIALSNANGTVVERYAYDPWGNRRNPTNWTQPDTRTAFLLNRGYTMHEHLDDFKLINMNGRVYDPLTAQFFSPDPYIQAPDNWLNYNRYTYAYGNPFKYTDPNGEFFWIIAGAFIGGIINWGMHGFEFSNDGLLAFGIGAAGGALAAATGGAALAGYGTAAGAGGFLGAAGAAGISYSAGTIVTSTGNNIAFGDPMPTGEQFAIGMGVTMVTAGTFNGTLAAMNGRNFWNGNVNPVNPTPAMPNLDASAAPKVKQPTLDNLKTPLKEMSDVPSPSSLSSTPENLGTMRIPNGEMPNMAVHGNSLQSQKPTWGYKLYDNEGAFLKNGITSKPVPQTRYTQKFMFDKRMVPIQQFPNRVGAWQWEYQQNLIQRGPLNLNMH
ncbi:MAG: hypothetical protein LBO74_14530 [Candidatus Symbiothrix sp.]|nr:hypothetical protein [Candidatus Symbiothrix sp.]